MQRLGNALLLGFVLGVPGAFFGLRLAETWTTAYTAQLLGGALGTCGGGVVLVGILVGVGLAARIAGWRGVQREAPPRVIDAGWGEPPRPARLPPPWGVTGGGNYELLPAREQDARFRMEGQGQTQVGGERR